MQPFDFFADLTMLGLSRNHQGTERQHPFFSKIMKTLLSRLDINHL